jgi:nucleoside-diphosphate-sugar epimerase
MDWNQQKVLVTGGASFISSHLIDELVAKGARSIRVVDDLTSGRLANIQPAIDAGIVEFHQEDLLQPGVPQRMVEGMDVVFHLAAIHGGRGFVDLHQAACAQNLAMDGLLVKAAHESGVDKFVFASSGCVMSISGSSAFGSAGAGSAGAAGEGGAWSASWAETRGAQLNKRAGRLAETPRRRLPERPPKVR